MFIPDDSENPEHLRHRIPAEPPGGDITDSPYRCYKINVAYVRFLVGALDYFTHDDAFAGTDDDCRIAAQRFVQLQNLFMTGNIPCEETEEMRLRQNPSDACQLQASYDNGASWELAFDYRLCFGSASNQSNSASLEASATAVAVANALAEIYLDDYHNIAPDLHFDGGDDDELRNQAYCFALALFLSEIGLILGEMESSGWEGWNINEILARVANIGIKLILGYVVVLGTAVHPVVLVATVLCERISDFILDWMDGNEDGPEITDYLLPETQEMLICCGMDVLQDMTPSPLRFVQMFDDCPDVELSPGVQELMDDLLGSERIYLAYLAAVQAAFEAISSGQRFNCPCEVDTLTFEFTTESGSEPNTVYGLGGWSVVESNLGCFNYIPEGGIFFGDETTGDYTNHRGVSMKRGGISGEIYSVEVQYNLALGIGKGSDDGLLITYGGETCRWDRALVEDGADCSERCTRYHVNEGENVFVSLFSDVRLGTTPSYTGSCKVERVILRGVGLSVD